MRLSRSEAMYRVKIIQENHLKKNAQAELDRYILRSGNSYKLVYTAHRMAGMMANIAFRVSDALISATRKMSEMTSALISGASDVLATAAEAIGNLSEACGYLQERNE